MKLAVCDDDRLILESFRHLIGTRSDIDAQYFTNAGELIAACAADNFDMIFTDIMLGGNNGIETARKAAALIPGVRIVFMTAYVMEYAEEIFVGLHPYGFIGKPLSRSRIEYHISRAIHEIRQSNSILTVRHSGAEEQILLSSIRFIESDRRQALIHCVGRTLTVYSKLSDLIPQLDERFVRCHQSYIVNLEFAGVLNNDDITLDNGTVVRISRNKLPETKKRYFEFKSIGLI